MILGSHSSPALIISLVVTGMISFVPEVIARGDALYLGDVADLDILPSKMRDRAAKLPLMKLPEGSDPITLRKTDIAARARALMPVLAPWFGQTDGTVSILRRQDDPLRLVAIATQGDGIGKSDRVRVKVKAGIFTIERQGVAMSDAKIGEQLFVRTEDRKALSVICCGK